MDGNLRELQIMLNNAAEQIPNQAMSIIEVEGINFIKKNFQDQGFNDGSLQKWQERKTTDSKGRDKTRYRTNRRGRQGELTKFGQREIGRAILTGHQTGGDKLRNSFRARREHLKVVFFTYKRYAQVHNEGTAKIPARPFMKSSHYLERRIKDKLQRTLDNLFR